MSRKNRPGFPNLSHYNGLLIDRTNHLYELVFGHPKYNSWSEFNENLPVESAYGIVPVKNELTSILAYTQDDLTHLSKKKSLLYLTERQKTTLPFLPIRGENEKKLIHRKLNEIVASNTKMGSKAVYDKLVLDWNTHHISIENNTYPKLAGHFSRYVKGWIRNQNRRDAAIASGSNKLFEALEYMPDAEAMPTFQPSEISARQVSTIQTASPSFPTDNLQDPTETPVQDTQNMCVLIDAACRQEPVAETETETETEKQVAEAETQTEEQEPKRKKRKKTCQGWGPLPCPDPSICPGAQWKRNCIRRTGGKEELKEKRTITKTYERTCQVCGGKGCPGSQNQGNCMYK